MAYNLRIPPVLDAEARLRCERLGISLNALICVALDAYLREPAPSAPSPASTVSASPGPAVSHVASLPAPTANMAAKLSKHERRQLAASHRDAKKH